MRANPTGHANGATRRFLRTLYRAAPENALIEIRFRAGAGMGQCFHRARTSNYAAETILALAARTDVYVGIVPRLQCSGRRNDLLQQAHMLWADCDTPASIAALSAIEPRPIMTVASGTAENRHAYWLLRKPIDLDQLQHANHLLALALGADIQSTDPGRILRPPGTQNRKSIPATPVRLVSLDERNRTDLDELERHLPHEPSPPDRPSQHDPSRNAPRPDPLLSIPPAIYVQRLTGQEIGRTRKIKCPFHDDRTPSLHVYETPERGWYCYGCRRGGTIYDLAACLWRRPARGGDFLELRRELETLFGLDRD